MSGGRRRDRIRGLAALVTLLALVIGLPVLLYQLGGSPLPGHIDGWSRIGRALAHRDSGWLFLAAVRDVSWIAWAVFTVAVLAEAQAAVRGRAAPRLRLGAVQGAAGRLVALALLTFGGPAAALLASQPAALASVSAAAPAAVPVAAPQPPSAGHRAGSPAPRGTGAPDPQVMSMGFYQVVTVRPGDCLWTIARRYLGDGDRFREIVQLNMGHEMGGGRKFTDPSVIWPGWVLQVPAHGGHTGTAAGGQAGSGQAGSGQASAPAARPPAGPARSGANGHGAAHGAHPSREHRYARPHPAADGSPGAAATGTVTTSAAPTAATAPPATAPARSGPAASPRPASAPGAISDALQLPPLAVFAAGMLAGGTVASLARLRHRQRQDRRRGRRIPLPADPAAVLAEQQIRAQQPARAVAGLQPATTLRAALAGLGASLVTTGQPLPEITGVRVFAEGLDVLLAAPAGEPPPAPFTVPGGHQGLTWRLPLPPDALPPMLRADAGDPLPGLFTVGATQDGQLLVDLEHLRVTTVEGPAELAGQVLASAGAELAVSELAGWYDLVLVGFGEIAGAGQRTTWCDSLDEALDLLAARAVTLRRRLGDADSADLRQLRIEQPDDEDWALTLMVSRTAPTPAQFSLLLDLCAEPAGLAALVPGGTAVPEGHQAPASIELTAAPGEPGGMTALVWPLGLQAWPRPLTEAGYAAIGSVLATAELDGDVGPGDPPYDGSTWPPRVPGSGPASDEVLAADEPDAGDPDPGEHAAPGAEGRAAANGRAAAADQAGAGESGAGGEDFAGELAASGARFQLSPVLIEETALPAAGEPFLRVAAEPVAADPVPPGAADPGAADPGPALPSLRIGVLGSFTINGEPAALQPAQSQLVLALALNGRDGLSNPQLCYLLGADPDHPRPSDSLRQLIVRTRRQLGRAPGGREWIEHLGSGQYALHPEARFDWAEFDELAEAGIAGRDAACLRSALRLLRGQPFAGCDYWWLDPALTETVRAQLVDAADLLAELELEAGDPPAAARAARTGLAGDAGAEQLWRALMRAEHAAGNSTGIREAWSRCLDAIAEIAADGQPHPQTTALYRELLPG